MSSACPLGAEMLACAFTLAGTNTPTPAELTAALAEMYPSNTGPTVLDLLAVGWLVPAISDRTRLRLPPLSPAEVDARLAAAGKPDKTRCFDAPALAESKNEARIKSEFSESLKKDESRHEAGIEAEKLEVLKRADNRQETDAEPPTPPATDGAQAELAGPLFSYYRGGIAATVPYAAITPAQLFTVLTSGRHRAATEALRTAPVGSPRRAELKKGLDYVTPAGTFTRRANEALAEASGLLVLDFDHVPDLAAARAALLADALLAPELVLLFTSPSGDGLKVLTKADPRAAHLDNFRAYAGYLAAHYAELGLCPDEAGKDVARACFVPYAPDAWLAPAYAA